MEGLSLYPDLMPIAEVLNHTFQHLLHVRYEFSYSAILESINSLFDFL